MSSSNLVVKMMSGEDMPDNDTSKGFTLVEAFGEVRCLRNENNEPIVDIPMEDGMTSRYRPEGNTYVMKNGKTVATFSFGLQQSKVEVIQSFTKLGGDKIKQWVDRNGIQTDDNKVNANAIAYQNMKLMHPNNIYKAIYDEWNKYKYFPFCTTGSLEENKHLLDQDCIVIPEQGADPELIKNTGILGYKEYQIISNPDFPEIKFAVLVKKDLLDGEVTHKLPDYIVDDVFSQSAAFNLLRLSTYQLPMFIRRPNNNRRNDTSVYNPLENYYKYEPTLSGSNGSDVYSLNITEKSFKAYPDQKAVVIINAQYETFGLRERTLYKDDTSIALVGKNIAFIVINNYACSSPTHLNNFAKELGELGYNQTRTEDKTIFWYVQYSGAILKHQTVIDNNWTESSDFKDGKPNVIMVPYLHLDQVEPLIQFFKYKPFKTVYTPEKGLCVLLKGESTESPIEEKREVGEARKLNRVHVASMELLKFLLDKTMYQLLPDVIIPEGDETIQWVNRVFERHDRQYAGYDMVLVNPDKLNQIELIKSELC